MGRELNVLFPLDFNLQDEIAKRYLSLSLPTGERNKLATDKVLSYQIQSHFSKESRLIITI